MKYVYFEKLRLGKIRSITVDSYMFADIYETKKGKNPLKIDKFEE